ncbi:presqualene diphosphate synthase HpnD [Sphingomonas quercus]|uniref:Presqualene diphosphate synthase HpnD n=1 Tax=Sphingomonas quercus TaxID=2842451 RepID=A0ABS6BQF7_9SPHN|nr:presqualene diphosphate synthase HpnD [Sphingomonas quercus]MBU3079450.1 presqualene diphosphate synthase HpnD [Sphingomonas quercus]
MSTGGGGAAALGTQASGSSFYAGMRILPKAEREAMYAIYGFCRLVDDIADDQQGGRSERAAALNRWRADIDALYAGGEGGQAAFLAPAVARFRLDQADFHAVIDGMMMDVEADMRWPDAATLDLYCDRVASAVGRLSVLVFGMERHVGLVLAHHLGRALQLTNILRDIDEDAAIGRVYLSRDALEAAGVPLTTPAEVAADPRVDAACRPLAALAHRHFREADAILSTRPRGHRVAPRLMSAAYGKLLARMEQIGWAPPRTRVRVSKRAILWTVIRLGLTR